jgi:hypothetical protein
MFDVHHRNGNHKDNRISNLQLLTHSEHMKHHAPDMDKTHLTAPFHERVLPAPGVNGWRPNASWTHWREWLEEDALRVYRYLRRVAVGEKRPARVVTIRSELRIGHNHLADIFYSLERLKFIQCKWGKLMPFTITVRDVPDVPEAVERQVKHLPAGVKLDVSRSDINRFLGYWCEKYEQHRSEPYHVVRGRDSKLVHDLLETYGLDELKRLAWFLLHEGAGSEVIRYEEVAIPTFAAKINRIAMEKKQG